MQADLTDEQLIADMERAAADNGWTYPLGGLGPDPDIARVQMTISALRQNAIGKYGNAVGHARNGDVDMVRKHVIKYRKLQLRIRDLTNHLYGNPSHGSGPDAAE